MTSAFTDWDSLGPVCSITQTAQVLGTSISTIGKALRGGYMVPPPMTVAANLRPGRTYQTRKWSTVELRKFVEGGHARYAGRQYFQRAKRKTAA